MPHTVAISDIHLCEHEPESGLWMRYRQAPYAPDGEIAAMLDALRAQVRGDALSLILNGDVFDFDAPRVVGAESVHHDLPRSAEHAVPTIEAILRDHAIFVAALGRIVADGHTVVFVSGNHDPQMTLPEVRRVIAARVIAAARNALGDHAPEGDEPLAARVVFRAWFHRTADGIIVEHGHQYDSYCSYRYPMSPFGRDPREIQPTMGSLVARHLSARMGYFNPHVDSSYMLSAIGYMAHWARYYLFSRRSLAAAWAVGAVRTLVELVRRREPGSRARRRANIAAAVSEAGAPLKRTARHARLFAPPAEDKLALVARELWIDRVMLGLLAAVAGLVWLIAASGPLAVGAVLPPILLLLYEAMTPKIPLLETWRRVSRAARRVARVHDARAVIFGHTHRPEGSWEDGVFFGNTGSWSAAYLDVECTRPLDDERPLVWLRSDARGALTGGLHAWKAGRFEARSGSATELMRRPSHLPPALGLGGAQKA
jgi:UDP-2,3-diacylglucosamine pyrophosphatase LpxH